MDNIVRIDIDEVRNAPNWSIRDNETIRQISIYCSRNPCERSLYDKIVPDLHYAALYPFVMNSFDFDTELSADKMSKEGRKVMKELLTKRKKYINKLIRKKNETKKENRTV